MARRAVCVGINEFATLPMSSWLSGCVNDAHDIAATLRTYGFTAAATTVLCDADATKPAVMAALTTMVETAEPGDHLVFSFSSHGTQVPNATGRPVLYAACRPAQTAADATFDGRSNGAFTYYLLGALRDLPDSSRRELHAAVTARLKRGHFEQRSTLEGPVAARKVGFGQPW